MNDKQIFTPVIRSAIRRLEPENRGHFTVYLPAYDDKKLVALLLRLPTRTWHIFSKHVKKRYQIESISVLPVSGSAFVESMAGSEGVITGGGFETPAEVLHLNKKLLIVPMKHQYEQHCNAAALKKMGVPVVKRMKPKNLKKLQWWMEEATPMNLSFPDVAADAVARAMKRAASFS